MSRRNIPTASETTSLLPSHETIQANRKQKPNGKYLFVIGAILFMALFIAAVSMSFFSNAKAKDDLLASQRQRRGDSGSVAPASLSFNEITMDNWDTWKAKVSDWMEEGIHGGDDISQHTRQFGKRVESWWNDTQSSFSNDEKVGERNFQNWWVHASEAEKAWWNGAQSTVSNGEEEAKSDFQDWWKHASKAEKAWWYNTQASLSNDEKIGKQHFRDWWAHASEAEKTWWNATTKQLRRDIDVEQSWWNAHRFGKRVKSWWNDAEASLSTDGEKAEALERNFRNWWEHASEAEKNWWNATVDQLKHDRDVEQAWWNATKEELEDDERVAEKIERKWWDATKGELDRDESEAARKEREWWNTTRKRMQRDKEAIAEKEREWWNATREQEQLDEAIAEKKAVLWWNMTKNAVRQDLKTTNQKEKEWWNATEQWFRQHVQNQNSGFDPSRMALLYLNSSNAYSLLTNEYGWLDFSRDFFLLQSGFDVQVNSAYSSVASSAALLNSLLSLVSLPIDPLYDPYPYATQTNLLENECVQKSVISHNDTYDGLLFPPGGLSLDQTKRLLECNLAERTWKVTAVHVDHERVTVDDVRRDLEDALRYPFKRVIVNYDRNGLGQAGGGHFSPVGSYSKQFDAFLVLDVAKYKYPSAWVPAKRLYNAMASTDSCGDWDYPEGQDRLQGDLLLHPRTSKEYRKAMKRLGCKATFRGYIIVSDTSDSSEKESF